MDPFSLREKLRGKRIVVFYGGWSSERDVSLRSGRKVYESLKKQGFDAVLLDVGRDYIDRLKDLGGDVVVIMLHGKPGEDGTIQGALETLGIPYTGSRVLASAVGMDKITTKRILLSIGIRTPDFVFVPLESDLKEKEKDALRKLGFPMIIKPREEGSSIGVRIIREDDDLFGLMAQEREDFGDFYLEKFIEGKSVTVGILGTRENSFALPSLELRVKKGEFYDYDAKYRKGYTEFIIPAELPNTSLEELEQLSLLTHRAVGCRGFSRVDAVVSRDGVPYILEINTIPGMTDLSDLPAEAEAAGISYDELALRILASAFE